MAFEDLGNPAGYKRSDIWNADYGKQAYGSYDNYTSRMKQRGNMYASGQDPLSGFARRIGGQIQGLGNQYGGINRWGARSAAPDDPILGGYMANIQGQQRNDINDATRAVAGAGIVGSRGGYGTAGGPAVDSMLRQGGMNSIARGASDRYDKAMGYAKDLYGGIADTWGQGINAQLGAYSKAGDLGLGYAGAERQGIEGQNQMFGMRREDLGADQAAQQAWGAGYGDRVRQRQMAEQQMRDAQQQRDQQQTLQQMTRQSYLGAPNTGYSPYEDEFARGEYLKQKGLIRGGGGKGGGSYNPSTLPGSRQIGSWDATGYPV